VIRDGSHNNLVMSTDYIICSAVEVRIRTPAEGNIGGNADGCGATNKTEIRHLPHNAAIHTYSITFLEIPG
jgi:hypothetical protein